METRRWTNPTQPQTLQIAVLLLYIDAVFGVLSGTVFNGIGVFLVGGFVAAGFGIANDRKWGYQLGLAMAVMPFVLRLATGLSLLGFSIINLMFEIALVALLLHPQSRNHQRIWFR